MTHDAIHKFMPTNNQVILGLVQSQVVSEFYSQLHITRCNHSRYFKIGMAESHRITTSNFKRACCIDPPNPSIISYYCDAYMSSMSVTCRRAEGQSMKISTMTTQSGQCFLKSIDIAFFSSFLYGLTNSNRDSLPHR